MRRTHYDKQDVINDLADGKLKPREIADKYGISVDNVWTIRSVARKKGLLNSRGYKTVPERLKDERSVFTAEIRSLIKDLRDLEYTSSEIVPILRRNGIDCTKDDVNKVMARGATGDHFEHRPKLVKRESPIDWQQRVRSLHEGGLSANEIIHCMRDTNLTDREIQEMIAYAEHWGKSGG